MSELPVQTVGWWLVLWAMASLLSGLAYPWFRELGAGLEPAGRSALRLAYACTAPVAAALALVLVSRPSLAGVLMPAHCHGSRCGMHAPVYPEDSMAVIGLATAASLAALVLVFVLVRALHRGRRKWRVLSAFTRVSPVGYRTLESDGPLAVCVGLLRPQILVSRGLVERLDAGELAVVLSHEQGHARRRDNLRMLLLRWCSLPWPAAPRRCLRADLSADAEQACDLVAAQRCAGPDQVARVIRKISGMASTIPAGRGIAFGCCDAAGRLAALDRGRLSYTGRFRDWLWPGVSLSASWCVQVYLLAATSHWLVEWLGSAVI